MFKISIGAEQSKDLQEKIERSLGARREQGQNYTEKEIKRVSELSRKLVSEGIELNADLLEPIRAAAALSNCELKPNPDFSSHRPVIGKIIVAVKRLTWPLVRFHLHRQFDALSEYNRWMLYSQVKMFEANRTQAK